MAKILVTNLSFSKFSKNAAKMLTDNGHEIIRPESSVFNEEEFNEVIGEIEAIITGLEPISKDLIGRSKNLKVIVKHGIGVDNIDLEAAKVRNVIVANAPGTNSEAVADLVFGFILNLSRHMKEADKKVRNGEWPKIFGTSVWGKTIGIIGFGQIGKGIAKRAKGFNMKILAYDKYWDGKYAEENQIEFAEIEDLISKSDIITLHVPLTEETHNMINADSLNKMKSSAILINASRGGVVNETDLYYALKNNVILGAGLDVFEVEPPINNPLLELNNTIFSPHMGGFTDQALGQTSDYVAQLVLDVLSGKEIKSRII